MVTELKKKETAQVIMKEGSPAAIKPCSNSPKVSAKDADIFSDSLLEKKRTPLFLHAYPGKTVGG